MVDKDRNKERLDGYKKEAVKFVDLAYQAGSIDQSEFHAEERSRFLNQVIKLAAMDGFFTDCNEKAMEYMEGFMKSVQEYLPNLKKNKDRLHWYIKSINKMIKNPDDKYAIDNVTGWHDTLEEAIDDAMNKEKENEQPA